jgi:glycine/D-amino acid oxidase-like deaminating enzyme
MFDYLIVGQGLAGSVLALTFFRHNKSVYIIDECETTTSSKIAGGIYNPVTGKRHKRTWMADATFAAVEPFYSYVEELLEAKILYPRTIYRPFGSVEEKEASKADLNTPQLAPYMKEPANPAIYNDFVYNEYGGLETTVSGYVDVPLLLSETLRFFSAKGLFKEALLDYNQIYIREDYVEWNDVKARKIVFCEGYRAIKNPYFSWLPFKPVKGEIITIATKQDIPQNIISQGVYFIPMSARLYRIGATYDWSELNNVPTERGRNELTEKVNACFKPAYQIIKQEAGVRPATRDRRPFLGLHPDHKDIAILNGLGTKGVSLAPYFAKELLDYLENGKELNKEADIQRFFSLYYKQV